MKLIDQGAVSGVGLAIIGLILFVCLRSSPAGPAAGPRTYRAHGAWYVFSAAAGAGLIGIFMVGYVVGEPDLRPGLIWCCVGTTIFFALFAGYLRSLRVMVDAERVRSRVLWINQSVELRNVDQVTHAGLVVEVRQKVDPATGKRGRALVFLAGLRGVRELIATIADRSGAAVQAKNLL